MTTKHPGTNPPPVSERPPPPPNPPPAPGSAPAKDSQVVIAELLLEILKTLNRIEDNTRARSVRIEPRF